MGVEGGLFYVEYICTYLFFQFHTCVAHVFEITFISRDTQLVSREEMVLF